MDLNWAHEQEKDNLSNLIKESLNKEWIYKFSIARLVQEGRVPG
jgi:hypothetical protein